MDRGQIFFFLTIASVYFLLIFNSVAFVIFYLRSFSRVNLFHQNMAGEGSRIQCAAAHSICSFKAQSKPGLAGKWYCRPSKSYCSESKTSRTGRGS